MAKEGKEENIKVVARCRPLLDHEKGTKSDQIEIDTESSRICANKKQSDGKALKHEFRFDGALSSHSTQEDVASTIGLDRLVEGTLSGFNSTILAYGQTGSGKTYTMEGRDSHQGVIPRALEKLFTRLDSIKGDSVAITCSAVQIYKEQAYDLLNPKLMFEEKRSKSFRRPEPDDMQGMRMRWSMDRGFYLEGLTWKECKNKSDVLDIFHFAQRNKIMAAHKLNLSSSRSHVLLSVYVTRHASDESKLQSCLSLVDLAGSERAEHTGSLEDSTTTQEATFINKSLLTLRKCIFGLSRGQGHIPFRDSKLTSLLKNSIGGSCSTVMIACFAPSSRCFDESLSTLQYATTARSIVNRVSQQEDATTRKFRILQEEIQRLKAQLARFQVAEPEEAPSIAVGRVKTSGNQTKEQDREKGDGKEESSTAKERKPCDISAARQTAKEAIQQNSSKRVADFDKLQRLGSKLIESTKLASQFHENWREECKRREEAERQLQRQKESMNEVENQNASLRDELDFLYAVMSTEDARVSGHISLNESDDQPDETAETSWAKWAKKLHTANSEALLELDALRDEVNGLHKENETLRQALRALEERRLAPEQAGESQSSHKGGGSTPRQKPSSLTASPKKPPSAKNQGSKQSGKHGLSVSVQSSESASSERVPARLTSSRGGGVSLPFGQEEDVDGDGVRAYDVAVSSPNSSMNAVNSQDDGDNEEEVERRLQHLLATKHQLAKSFQQPT